MILVVGHYCHDTLIGNDGEHRALGGSAAYVSAVLEALGERHRVFTKVGADFRYGAQVAQPPRIAGARTTSFVDDYRGGERRERVDAVCEPIFPHDIQGSYEVGIACGVAGEVLPETISAMRAACRVLVADAQSILREISPAGEVLLRPPHPAVLSQLDFLKASRREAESLDVNALRQRLILLITDGPRGCTVLNSGTQTSIPPFPANERDPTGAGDCFLAGFAAGIARGLDPIRAARIGAYCGARAVEQIGVPRLNAEEARAATRLTSKP